MSWTLALYLAMVIIGIVIGSKCKLKDHQVKLVQRLQMAALILLIFTMGVKIGADDRVVSSMATLGMQAFVLTVSAIIGSVLMVFLGRKLMKINKEGLGKND